MPSIRFGSNRTADAPAPELVLAELDRILASEVFSRSDRLSAFLEWTAAAVLASAGIAVTWRECSGNGCVESAGRASILVQLLPIRKMADGSIAGEVMRDPRRQMPAILIYVPRHQELVQAVQLSSEGRAHPALATLATGHLIGLTIAHEIGHVLGLSHSASGVMKSRLSTDDILASRTSLPVFRKREADAMRQRLRASLSGYHVEPPARRRYALLPDPPPIDR